MNIASTISLIKILLEIPSNSNWSDDNFTDIIKLALRKLSNSFDTIDYYPTYQTETVTLTTLKQYTLTKSYRKLLNIYQDELQYEQIDIQDWPHERNNVFWWDRANKHINFFTEPCYSGAFIIVAPGDLDLTDPSDIPEELEHLLVLQSCVLIGKSEKEQIDAWKEEISEGLYDLQTAASKSGGPKYVNQRSFPRTES